VRSLVRSLRASYWSVWVANILLFIVSFIVAPRSLSAHSIDGMLSFASVLIVVAIGQTLVVQQRGLDLSVPGVITLCAMVLPISMSRGHLPFAVAVIVTLGVGAVIGLANGLLVTQVGITPLIVTLAMGSILTGVVFFYTGGLPSTEAPSQLVQSLAPRVFGVPTAFLIAALIVVVVAILMVRSSAGRRFVAAGSNVQAARAAGIGVASNVVGAYILSGVGAAVASMLLTGYVGSATITLGDEYLFTSIAAVVVGGTSFLGGRGSVVASAMGAIFLTQLVQLLLATGAPASAQLLAQALAIALAVALRTVIPRVAQRGPARAQSSR
jgi:ribose transport system permease protein